MGSDYTSGIKCGICRRILCNQITAPWCRGSRMSVRFPLFKQLLTSFVMLMSLQFTFVFVTCCFSLCSYLCHFVTSSVCLGFSVMFFSVFLRLCVFFLRFYILFLLPPDLFGLDLWTLVQILPSVGTEIFWVDALGSLKTGLWNSILLSLMLQVVL